MRFAYWKFLRKSVWFKFSQALIKQIEYIYYFFTIVDISLKSLYGDIYSENVPYISDIKIMVLYFWYETIIFYWE